MGSLEFAVCVLQAPPVLGLGHPGTGAVAARVDALGEVNVLGGYYPFATGAVSTLD
jgi:hypothetical protein